MSWMNSEPRGGADKRTEGEEEIGPDFPQGGLVRFSGGQTSQKSRNEDPSHPEPRIVSHTMAESADYQADLVSENTGVCFLIRLKTGGSKARCKHAC